MGERKIREEYEMSEMGNLELASADSASMQPPVPEVPPVSREVSPYIGLRSSAAQLARGLAWVPEQQESTDLRDRCHALSDSFRPLLAGLDSQSKNASDDFQRLLENVSLLHAELEDTSRIFDIGQKIPQVRTPDGAVISRVA